MVDGSGERDAIRRNNSPGWIWTCGWIARNKWFLAWRSNETYYGGGLSSVDEERLR
jgi:hypothetical protein